MIAQSFLTEFRLTHLRFKSQTKILPELDASPPVACKQAVHRPPPRLTPTTLVSHPHCVHAAEGVEGFLAEAPGLAEAFPVF